MITQKINESPSTNVGEPLCGLLNKAAAPVRRSTPVRRRRGPPLRLTKRFSLFVGDIRVMTNYTDSQRSLAGLDEISLKG